MIMTSVCMDSDAVAERSVRFGNRTLSRAAGELHLFGVLLGAHAGRLGFVPAHDVAGLPSEVREAVDELLDTGMWSRAVGGYAIDPDQNARTIQTALDRLNDPDLCAATRAAHVRENGRCTECGAELASVFA
jgi:hypothetical protein